MDNNYQNQNPMYQNYNQQMPAADPNRYIDFVEAIKLCLNKYTDFSGRATRAEYWWWYLFTFVVSAVVGWIPYFGWLVAIAVMIPSLAVSWRRMHDIGKGGGWYFINLIPLVGWILWIVWCCRQSEPYPNRFGPQPMY